MLSTQTYPPLRRTGRASRNWLLAAAAVVALSGAGVAQAADVYWSIGVHQPGVQVGVSNAPPRVVYGPPPVVVYGPPVYRAGWAPPGHGKHWHKHRDRHHGWDDDHRRDHRHGGRDRDDRHDRWDDRRDHRR